MSELADEHDLGSCAERRRSSSLLIPIDDRDLGTCISRLVAVKIDKLYSHTGREEIAWAFC